MIRRKTESNVGIVLDSDEDEDIIWCKRCLSHGDKCKMGEKILLNNELPKSDDSDFFQCHQCYYLVPRYQARHEGEIFSDLDIISNPFDFAAGVVVGDDNTLKGRMKNLKRRRKIASRDHTSDKELSRLIQDGWEVTAYSQSVPNDPNEAIIKD